MGTTYTGSEASSCPFTSWVSFGGNPIAIGYRGMGAGSRVDVLGNLVRIMGGDL